MGKNWLVCLEKGRPRRWLGGITIYKGNTECGTGNMIGASCRQEFNDAHGWTSRQRRKLRSRYEITIGGCIAPAKRGVANASCMFEKVEINGRRISDVSILKFQVGTFIL